MGTASQVVDMANLSLFSPLNRLGPARAEELLVHSRIERLPPGKRLFGIGDSDGRSIFLLAGQLALVSADNRIRMLKAATPEAGQAIADNQPREATALARTAATVLCIDSEVLESLLRKEADAECVPAPAELDLGPIFASPLFARLPAENLQTLMERMDVVPAKAGDVIVREGEDSAWYYIIESGRFGLSRRHGRKGRDDGLGELGPLESIGEAALIADELQEATVTALEDGRLLRFAKDEFLTHIVRPYIRRVSQSDVAALALKGGTLLDVRSHKSFARHHQAGSINMPLRLLRQTAGILDRTRSYIVSSDNVRRSAAAAFLLVQQGMEAMILGDTARAAPRPARRNRSGP